MMPWFGILWCIAWIGFLAAAFYMKKFWHGLMMMVFAFLILLVPIIMSSNKMTAEAKACEEAGHVAIITRHDGLVCLEGVKRVTR